MLKKTLFLGLIFLVSCTSLPTKQLDSKEEGEKDGIKKEERLNRMVKCFACKTRFAHYENQGICPNCGWIKR